MNDELYHHGIKGQKWGVRRFQNPDGTLTPVGKARYSNSESAKYARGMYNKAVKAEPRITYDIQNVVGKTSAKMYGLEHRLKTEESIKRKIETDAFNDDISIKQSASKVKDTVRYTAVSNDQDFTKNYKKIKRQLIEKGYSELRCKNYFDLYRQGKVKHKSVQSVFISPKGHIFEIQFQTNASQKAKDKKIPLYEEARQKDISPDRLKQLEKQMEKLAEEVPDPDNVYNIKTYSRR